MVETPITDLLVRWREGSPDADAALMNAVYPVLRELARMRLNRGSQPVVTLQPTELANEAYARLQVARGTDWQSRVHFFAITAKIIRGLAVDYARSRDAEKRGGNLVFVPLEAAGDQATSDGAGESIDILAINAALDDLERQDALSARIVELKYFSGLTTAEIAEVCGISSSTVVRQWRFARAWLADHLQS